MGLGGGEHRCDARGVGSLFQPHAGVAKQTLAEGAQFQEVEILLPDQVIALAESANLGDDVCRKSSSLGTQQASFGEKLQTVAGSVAHEFVEVEAVVVLAEFVVIKMFGL